MEVAVSEDLMLEECRRIFGPAEGLSGELLHKILLTCEGHDSACAGYHFFVLARIIIIQGGDNNIMLCKIY